MAYTAAVITVSDKGFRGERKDTSGPALVSLLKEAGFTVLGVSLVPDEKELIEAELLRLTDTEKAALVLTTGGTGFSPRDVTPEATKAVIERETPGLSERMRAESMKITPKGCLSRSVCGIRGRSLIVNLPGSEKAARENLEAILGPLAHGLDMLYSAGSADCGEPVKKLAVPSIDGWIAEAEAGENTGMYLIHRGIVRSTARAEVREGKTGLPSVKGMRLSCNKEKAAVALLEAERSPGITTVKLFVNEGTLAPGDTILQVLVAGDIRPHVLEALTRLVDTMKSECLSEEEVF